MVVGLTPSSVVSYPSIPTPISIIAPVQQQILTQSTNFTVQVNAPTDTAVEIWANGSKLGDASNVGGGIWEYVWNPGSVDYDVPFYALGDVTGATETLTLVVAEANGLNQTLSSWSQLTLFTTSMSSGQSDPFGGTSAWRFNNPTAASSQRAYYTSVSPSITVANSGVEIWLKPDQITMVCVVVGNNGGYINLVTGETQSTNVFVKKIEDGANGWKRYWFARVNQSVANSGIFIYPVTTWGTLVATTTSGDGFYIYRPRSANGVLPYFPYQQCIWYHASTSGTVQTWNYHSPYIDTIADMGAGYYNIQVIRPSTWSSSNPPYQTIIMAPALDNAQETSAGNQTPAQVAVAQSIADTYNAVVCIPLLKTGAIYWWGIKNDGSINQKTFLAKCVTEFLVEFHNVARGRNNRTLMGYSKSAWGAMSVMLQFPEEFGFIVLYDSPWNQYATDWSANQAASVFGNEATFDANDPIQILPSYLSSVNDALRITLIDYNIFGSDIVVFHNALDSYSIAHDYLNNNLGSHSWNVTPWVADGLVLAQANRAAI